MDDHTWDLIDHPEILLTSHAAQAVYACMFLFAIFIIVRRRRREQGDRWEQYHHLKKRFRTLLNRTLEQDKDERLTLEMRSVMWSDVASSGGDFLSDHINHGVLDDAKLEHLTDTLEGRLRSAVDLPLAQLRDMVAKKDRESGQLEHFREAASQLEHDLVISGKRYLALSALDEGAELRCRRYHEHAENLTGLVMTTLDEMSDGTEEDDELMRSFETAEIRVCLQEARACLEKLNALFDSVCANRERALRDIKTLEQTLACSPTFVGTPDDIGLANRWLEHARKPFAELKAACLKDGPRDWIELSHRVALSLAQTQVAYLLGGNVPPTFPPKPHTPP